MKKSLVLICALTFVLILVGRANAVVYTETINLGSQLGGVMGTLNGNPGGYFHQGFDQRTYNWSFTTPADFEVPYDQVNSADVSVVVGWIDTFGDDHFVVGTQSLGLNSNTATYDLPIGDLFLTWPNGGTVNASLVILEDERTINHPEWNGDLFLGASTFTLDYTNVAPVPEPATMSLLGMGVLGLLGFKRRKA